MSNWTQADYDAYLARLRDKNVQAFNSMQKIRVHDVAKPAKRHKFGVSEEEDRTCDGIVFSSKKEMEAYQKLKALEKSGQIWDLELQPRFVLQDAFEKNGKKYKSIEIVPDFSYSIRGHGYVIERHVIDVKSKATMTPVFRLKQKMFEKKYPDLTLEIW